MKHLLPIVLFAGFATGFATNTAVAAEAANPAAKDAKSVESVNLAKLFDNKLVDAKGKRVKSDDLARVKYVAVYFSAHWCPPCRAFTPKLVKFVEEHKKGDNFAVVFVSFDRSEKDMLGYMSEAGMSWGGMLGRGARLKGIDAGINGIPHLRVFDASGKVVADSVENGEYVGPGVVLAKLEKLIK